MEFLKYYFMANNLESDILIYNLFTDNLFLVDKKYRHALNSIARGDFQANEQLFNYLNERNFIVNSNDEIFQMINKKFIDHIHSKERLRLTIIPTDACNFNCVYCCQDEPYHFLDDKTEDNIVNFMSF